MFQYTQHAIVDSCVSLRLRCLSLRYGGGLPGSLRSPQNQTDTRQHRRRSRDLAPCRDQILLATYSLYLSVAETQVH